MLGRGARVPGTGVSSGSTRHRKNREFVREGEGHLDLDALKRGVEKVWEGFPGGPLRCGGGRKNELIRF